VKISSIALTPAERKWAEWAVDPMGEYWVERAENGDAVPTELPILLGRLLLIPQEELVVVDLLYRVEVQATDITEEHAVESGRPAATLLRPIRSLARKIRDATGYRGSSAP